MFKEGDYVTVKSGAQTESKVTTHNWAGKIIFSIPEDQCCIIELDSITLKLLPDDHLKFMIENGLDSSECLFDFKDLEHSKRRDNEVEYASTLSELFDRMLSLEGLDGLSIDSFDSELFDYEERDEALEVLFGSLTLAFNDSSFFGAMTAFQKEHSDFIVGNFLDLMFVFEEVGFDQWSPNNIRAVCIKHVPSEVLSTFETFEIFGDVIIQFLNFLDSIELISNAPTLIKAVNREKSKIIRKAKNPANWSLRKAMISEAIVAGVDIDDEDELNSFIATFEDRMIDEFKQFDQYESAKVIPLNPFKDIGRNQKIKVKYKDGKILEDIKFKKVETDLKEGRCEIIKK